MTETPGSPSSEIQLTDAIMAKPGAGIMGTEIAWPSDAYNRHCEAISYRVSELIFGSLLASYILGFIAVGTSLRSNLPPIDTVSSVVIIVQALCVSICFSYLTAATYLTYHTSILTMPHFQTSNLRWDFAIAILQAILFGISVICLQLFPIMVALSLFAVFLRQKNAFVELSDHFWNLGVRAAVLKPEGGETRKKRDRFRKAIEDIRREDERFEDCMAGWLPVSRRLWKWTTYLLAAGLLNVVLQFLAPRPGPFPKLSWFSPTVGAMVVQSAFYVIMTIVIFSASSHVFLRSHELTKNVEGADHKLRIDDGAEELIKKLRPASSAQSK